MRNILVLLVALLPLAAQAQYKSEYRVFKITIDGHDAGTYTQTITTYGEGTTDFFGKSDVKIKVLGITYQQAFRGQERWKDGKLLHLSSASNDNGTPHTLVIDPINGQLKVKADGKERMNQPNVWSTSYWTLPPEDQRDKTVYILDADSGIEMAVKLQNMGKESQIVNGQRVTCTHYKLNAGNTSDLWFDENDRLVRRDGIRKGKKVSLMLVSSSIK
ncbi:MAG: DUF6134 family protein [Gemmatales bacterium]